MVDIKTFKELALSFPDTIEQPHFEKTSFRIKKKIFATLSIENNIACLKLSPIDQSVFCSIDKTIIYPVPNKWGQQGATLIDLKKVRKSILKDALTTAYNEVSKSRSK
ncbi:MAG TPA: MmcQ/YjbR family DNA-binding protein [Chitinophagaceae bacterium]|nr:MmcQ/YjbR family DNA-binding protein [Chitinophagaceae bacterium]